MGEFLRPEGFAGPRGLRALSREGSAVIEAARFFRRARADRRISRTLPFAGPHRAPALEPVLLVPGFMAGDSTLFAMHRSLRNHGYRTYGSRTHLNVDCTRGTADRLERRLEALVARRGRKVSIVGHSLGGMLARGLAARRPDLIAGIVTMGSPMVAPGAVHGVLAWDADLLTRLARIGLTGVMGQDCIAGECARLSFEETRTPLAEGIGFTTIYSRRDGVVDWRACIDPQARAVEVRTSHLGMAFDPYTIDKVLDALALQRMDRITVPATAPVSEGEPATRTEAPRAAEALPPAAST